MENVPPHQQQQFMTNLEQMQTRDSFTMYTNVVSRCFDTCVHKFKSKNLDSREGACVENCAERYAKLTMRGGVRFAERNATLQQQAMLAGPPK
mmetsp:Transcript_3415/g.5115  ORF Transcript_3415/g.5115 Transcript_3415/m.5115 type:complete len:93 (+) Transcript_3415:84-362(+)